MQKLNWFCVSLIISGCFQSPSYHVVLGPNVRPRRERAAMGSYTALSRLMSQHPEVFVIRAFSELHTKNIIYYQAELAELEAELDRVEQEDQNCSESPRETYSKRWKTLSGTGLSTFNPGDQAASQDARCRLQWSLMLRVRAVLKDYGTSKRL